MQAVDTGANNNHNDDDLYTAFRKKTPTCIFFDISKDNF